MKVWFEKQTGQLYVRLETADAVLFDRVLNDLYNYHGAIPEIAVFLHSLFAKVNHAIKQSSEGRGK